LAKRIVNIFDVSLKMLINQIEKDELEENQPEVKPTEFNFHLRFT
jgi:hypothetical protein